MRLLVVSDYTDPTSSRPEAEIYLALAARGYAVTVVTHAESVYTARFRAAGVRVLLGHPVARRDAHATWLLRSELLGGDYDALVLYNSRAIANGVRAARGIDVVVVAYRGNASGMSGLDPTNYLKIYHPRVDAILCNSAGVQAHVRANQWWRRDRTHVVPKGHDRGWYAGVEPLDRAEFGVPDAAPLIVCVANAQRVKGIPVLLEAFALLDPSLGAHLVVCGRGHDTRANAALIAGGPHPERVILTGFRPDVHRVVRAADVKVLASTGGESLTKSVIEAMALGTPVVITAIPGNAELVEDGVSGLTVPPGDAAALAGALARVCRDAGLRQTLAAGARARLAGPLSHARAVGAMDRFYRKVTAEHATN